MTKLPPALLLLAMTVGTAGAQPSASASDDWEFFVSPFLWGAGIDGDIGFAAREVDFEVSAQDLMKSLDFGIMGNLLARRNRWAIGFDAVYTDLSKDVAVANENVAARNPRLDMSMTILSGDDSLTLPMLAVGAEGIVSVVANLVPRDVMALIEAFERGDLNEARRRHLALFPLCRDLLAVAANPIPVKTAMALLGRGTGELRLPLCPPEDSERQALQESLARYGLLSADAR